MKRSMIVVAALVAMTQLGVSGQTDTRTHTTMATSRGMKDFDPQGRGVHRHRRLASDCLAELEL